MTAAAIGSLCTGYGGLDMAVAAVMGGRVAWVCDPDPHVSALVSHHWPDLTNHGDLTTADWAAAEDVDVVCGGYPCQPFSYAGHRKGTQDERHLWPHIADVLRIRRPRYAFFENVAGHVSLGLDTVLADLADIGFDAEWTVVRASDVGAPHNRRRLFIAARLQDTDVEHRDPRFAASGQAEGGRARPEPARRGRVPAADAEDVGQERGGPARDGRHGLADDDQHPVADADRDGLEEQQRREPGVGARGDADRCGTQYRHVPDSAGDGRHARRAEPARLSGQPGVAVGGDLRGPVDWGRFAAAVRRWEAVTGREAPPPTDVRGRLSAVFVEWMMGLPPGHVTGVPGLSRAAQLTRLGNGVVPQQAVYALRILLPRLNERDFTRAA